MSRKKKKNGIRIGYVQDPAFTVYTDGGCAFNPGGPGGYGVVVIDNATGEVNMLSGGFRSTTNNRMELMAAIVAMESLPDNATAVIYSDSQYFLKCFSGEWSREKNRDLFARMDIAAKGKELELRWVPGHTGNKYNELCDQLAGESMSNPSLPPDVGYDGVRREKNGFFNEVDRHIASGNFNAMSVKISVPDHFRNEIEMLEPKDYAEKYHLNDTGAITICNFAVRDRKRFSDYAALKTGGFDYWSGLKMAGLAAEIPNAEELMEVIRKYHPNEKDAMTALRWYGRGLSLEDCIRKVLVDREIRANVELREYKYITHK